MDPLSTLPFSTVVIEQALVASGDRRLRLVATLKVRRPPGQELDIEVRAGWVVVVGPVGSSWVAMKEDRVQRLAAVGVVTLGVRPVCCVGKSV